MASFLLAGYKYKRISNPALCLHLYNFWLAVLFLFYALTKVRIAAALEKKSGTNLEKMGTRILSYLKGNSS